MMRYFFEFFNEAHTEVRIKSFFASSEREAVFKADEWAYSNGYVDFRIVKV